MRVLVVFGGRSGEHEVSVISGRSVADALRTLGHEMIGVGITREGAWVHADPHAADRVADNGEAFRADIATMGDACDVAFPVLHGPHGEDGSIQGLFELAGIPYVGAGVEGSAIGINKVTHKRLFADAGLPVVDFVGFARREWEDAPEPIVESVAKLGYPCFAKPVHLGSSVGISKVHDESELVDAVGRALRHDDDVIVEAQGLPREVEVGVLGEPPRVSVLGEPIPDGDFYDYRAKYLGDWTELRVPADVPPLIAERVTEYAVRAFRAARCEGFARVDFFFDPATESLQVNEINTVPGMTPTSMFPRVWEATGMPFSDVVQALLDEALERHARKSSLEAARTAAHDEEISGGG
jgi:D-alanine-D-alanine ligase